MNFSFRLKTLREKRGFSQYRLAQQSGISQSFLSALEAGTKWPTIYTLNKICKCLGISLAEFFADDAFPIPEHVRPLIDEARRLNPDQCKKLAEFLASLNTKNQSV
ncbi:MAG: helix-turn-helix transcriptional regulator [Peptococcaceae bacterium]|nr:helix-turn-helix transcriptional regulator [Peptococcaceae bacterium]